MASWSICQVFLLRLESSMLQIHLGCGLFVKRSQAEIKLLSLAIGFVAFAEGICRKHISGCCFDPSVAIGIDTFWAIRWLGRQLSADTDPCFAAPILDDVEKWLQTHWRLHIVEDRRSVLASRGYQGEWSIKKWWPKVTTFPSR